MDEDALRAMLPMAFGSGGGGDRDVAKTSQPAPQPPLAEDKTKRETGNPPSGGLAEEPREKEEEHDFCGPMPPPDDDYDDAHDQDGFQSERGVERAHDGAPASLLSMSVPCSSEAALEQHGKAVTALDIDSQGGRLVTGSTDYKVKIFDFTGMRADCKAFKTIEPSEGHPVLALSWSPTGDAFLAVTGSAQPKIYTRDGEQEGEFPRGDMYIRDLKNTTGHITSCTDGAWHPTDKGSGITSSADGTVRVWDMWAATQNTVIKPTLRKPGRTAVTAVRYNHNGTLIAGGLEDGTIQVWDIRGKHQNKANVGMVAASKFQSFKKQNWTVLSKSNRIARAAHADGTNITCLRFGSKNPNALLSRNETDGTLKLWDLRNFNTPVAAVQHLPTGFISVGNTQCCFSPNEDLVLTAVGATQSADGHIDIYDAELNLVKRLGCRHAGSVIALTWHPRLNQIAYGCGDRKQGAGRILYDTDISASDRGIIPAVGRRPRVEADDQGGIADLHPEIHDPSAIRIISSGNKRRVVHKDGDADDTNPKQGKRAARPAPQIKTDGGKTAFGAGGRLGVGSHSSILTQYLLKNQGVLKPLADEDVRDSILRHAGQEGDDIKNLVSAYKDTQPTTIFQSRDESKDDDEAV